MKAIFRYAVALLVVGPFFLFIQIARLFIGKQKAVDLCGPLGTTIAKMVSKLVVPTIENPDFAAFKEKYKKRWILGPTFSSFISSTVLSVK